MYCAKNRKASSEGIFSIGNFYRMIPKREFNRVFEKNNSIESF